MTFKARLTIIFVFTSLVPLFFLQVYLVGRYSRQQKEKISVLITDNLAQTKDNLASEMEDFRNLILSLMTDSTFTETIHKMMQANADNKAWFASQLEAALSQATYQKKSLLGILYYSPEDGILVNYNKALINTEDIFQHAGGLKQAVSILENNSGGMTVLPATVLKDRSGSLKSIFLLGSRFYDLLRIEHRGYIFLIVNEEVIHTLLNPPTPYKNSIFSYTFLLDDIGNPCSFIDKTVFAQTHQGSSGEEFFRNNYPSGNGKGAFLVREIPLEKYQWKLITVFRTRELYGDVSFFRLYTLSIGVIAVLLTLYVIRKYISHIADTVLTLRNSMKIENDQLHFNVPAGDDLEYLNRSFILMKDKIDALLKEQKEKNENLFQMQEERRQAEIRAIEAQVNPHFLYNTLNSLNWMAIERNDTEMSQALTDLAGILRYSISRISSLTTVREEIDWLIKYLNLQKLRFDCLFDYDIDWDESTGDFRMYKLLIQPYIENAIIHGFHGLNYTGRLTVQLKKEAEGGLTIVIEDNGKGFDPASVKKTSIGMESSIYRMNLYYRGKAHMNCRSEPGRGTVITLHIPELQDETADS